MFQDEGKLPKVEQTKSESLGPVTLEVTADASSKLCAKKHITFVIRLGTQTRTFSDNVQWKASFDYTGEEHVVFEIKTAKPLSLKLRTISFAWKRLKDIVYGWEGELVLYTSLFGAKLAGGTLSADFSWPNGFMSETLVDSLLHSYDGTRSLLRERSGQSPRLLDSTDKARMSANQLLPEISWSRLVTIYDAASSEGTSDSAPSSVRQPVEITVESAEDHSPCSTSSQSNLSSALRSKTGESGDSESGDFSAFVGICPRKLLQAKKTAIANDDQLTATRIRQYELYRIKRAAKMRNT